VSPSKRPQSVDILGVRIESLPMQTAARRICDRAQQPGAVYVTKPYVEFLDHAAERPDIRELLNDSFLNLPDGVSLQWAAAYLYGGRRSWWRALGLAAQIVLRPQALGSVIPERFAGTNFTWELLRESAKSNLSVYVVGKLGQDEIDATATAIKQALPTIKIAGAHPGVLGGIHGRRLADKLENKAVEAELARELNKVNPDLILVGMGFPLQERVMAKLAPRLQRGVLVGEGGTFDYESFGGQRQKAPPVMQQLGLEWAWRLWLEPHRLHRQLAIPRFMWRVYQEGRRQNHAKTR
jgi:N-acetylglucosaminyldiphosphoundecaprenol N-acetyl-beta-D-mannosaminyltransferase